MPSLDDLTKFAEEVLTTKFEVRNGTVIPESEDLSLTNDAVKIDATFLYADLAGSSLLAKVCPWDTTAKIIRAYIECCTRIIRSHGGEIRSFDGDRVMGIFKSDTKNSTATRCAREIDWMVEKVINPKAKAKFKSIENGGIHIKHCVGIDTGEARAVRAGIRKNNDLIWIGRAPSFSAKLSDIREYPYAVFITKSVYDKLSDDTKNGSDGNNIWEVRTIEFAGEKQTVYRTKVMRSP